MLINIFLIICACYVPFNSAISTRIPSHLLNCYRKNATDIQDAVQAPHTIELLIELIRKVELFPERVTDMRILSSSMLHSMKFDGIQRANGMNETEFMVPVGPTSMHFTLYKILMDYLIPGHPEQFPIEALSNAEMCMLHLMLSSSVQAWERGDESKTCPTLKSMPHNRKYLERSQKSKCPIEKGVVRSSWGNIATGSVLSAVAAALQRQDVKLMQLIKELDENDENHDAEHMTNHTLRNVYTGDVNNVWAGTLAGDLAEVIIHQALYTPKWIVGTAGIWNDNVMPTNYYLPDSIEFHWEMTLAETLGGIDGVVIASMIEGWVKSMGRLHLSQVLDMYYSKRGVAFDDTYKVCNRKAKIVEILKNVDLVEQIKNVAKLLQRASRKLFIPDKEIEEFSINLNNHFQSNLDALTDIYSACEQKTYELMPMDIIAIIDGSWNHYEGHQLITALTHVTDISHYGSKIGFISGNKGDWLTNITNSIYKTFEDLAGTKALWPTSLSLENSFQTVVEYLQKKHKRECTSNIRSPRTNVVLVLSTTSAVGTLDIENSRSLVQNIKGINPGIPIIYMTSESAAESFKQLANNEYMNDVVIRSQPDVLAVTEKVYEQLKHVPGQILELHCDLNKMEYEDYVTPGIPKTYLIPYSFVQAMNIKVEFKSNGYGDLLICGRDKENPTDSNCKTVSQEGSVEFPARQLCSHGRACDVQFQVSLTKSKYKCTENDCRYPDQARLSISTSWTSSATTNTSILAVLLTFLAICIAF